MTTTLESLRDAGLSPAICQQLIESPRSDVVKVLATRMIHFVRWLVHYELTDLLPAIVESSNGPDLDHWTQLSLVTGIGREWLRPFIHSALSGDITMREAREIGANPALTPADMGVKFGDVLECLEAYEALNEYDADDQRIRSELTEDENQSDAPVMYGPCRVSQQTYPIDRVTLELPNGGYGRFDDCARLLVFAGAEVGLYHPCKASNPAPLGTIRLESAGDLLLLMARGWHNAECDFGPICEPVDARLLA